MYVDAIMRTPPVIPSLGSGVVWGGGQSLVRAEIRVKCLLILSNFNQNWTCKNFPITNFMKIHSEIYKWFHTERQTHVADLTGGFLQFCA
jgi:hypothetical protein